MKLAVISDTHFGDPDCLLAAYRGQSSRSDPMIGSRYEQFRSAAGLDNDFLIVLGDILDFSVCSYRETFEVAQTFFRQVQTDRVAQSIIYVPGNHDADVWHLYEYEVNIIRRIAAGKKATDFRYSIPGIIDGRRETNGPRFRLHGVKPSPQYRYGYGGTFLDSITLGSMSDGSCSGDAMNFALAYPNLYLLTDKGSILLTHGHYLEEYWAMLGEWAIEIAGSELGITGSPTIRQMVQINFPLNQLACSGAGQAGPLTENVILPLQRDARNRDSRRIERYVDGILERLDRLIPGKYVIDEIVSDALLRKLRSRIVDAIRSVEPTRYNDGFVHEAHVQERFKRCFRSCCAELLEFEQPSLPVPKWFVFGHSHRPIPWQDELKPGAPAFATDTGTLVRYCNLGGWLKRPQEDVNQEFCGAEVLTFDSDTQVTRSHHVS